MRLKSPLLSLQTLVATEPYEKVTVFDESEHAGYFQFCDKP